MMRIERLRCRPIVHITVNRQQLMNTFKHLVNFNWRGFGRKGRERGSKSVGKRNGADMSGVYQRLEG